MQEVEGVNLDVPMAQHLLVAADRFQLLRLRRICESRLCETVEVRCRPPLHLGVSVAVVPYRLRLHSYENLSGLALQFWVKLLRCGACLLYHIQGTSRGIVE